MLCAGWAIALWPNPEQLVSVYFPLAREFTDSLGVENSFEIFTALEISLNVLVYVPFACIIFLGLRYRPVTLTLGFSLLMSILGEVVQWLFLPMRVPTFVDVLSNLFGAILGVALGLLLKRQFGWSLIRGA
jgi:VanZ family protein